MAPVTGRRTEGSARVRARLAPLEGERRADPFEASFLVLTGVSYLQAFPDGNKRLARLLCNIPLLRAGKAPMSFIGVDKAEYLMGLIALYELDDLRPLAGTVSSAYAQAAPSYAAALAIRRLPRSIELQERQRMDSMVQDYVKRVTEGSPIDASSFARDRLHDLGKDDQSVLLESFLRIIAALTRDNAGTWGVGTETAERFVAQRDTPSSE